MASTGMPRRYSTASGRRTRSGWETVRPRRSAACFTGDAAAFCPRPLGRSGCVSTAATSWPASTMASSVGTAKAGVPRKIRRIGAYLPATGLTKTPVQRRDAESAEISAEKTKRRWLSSLRRPLRSLRLCVELVFLPGSSFARLGSGSPLEHVVPRSKRLAPVPGALQLLDLALHQVALQRADVGDVQLPVEVIGFVQQRARQQIFGGLLEHFAPRVPRPYGDAAAPLHLLPESGDTQAAFFALLLAIDLHDRRVDQHHLVFGLLAIGDVNYGDLARNADLRRRQAHSFVGDRKSTRLNS